MKNAIISTDIVTVAIHNRVKPPICRFTWNGRNRKRGYVLSIQYVEGGKGHRFARTIKELNTWLKENV